MTGHLRSRAFSDRVVLLGLVALSAAGETPAHTGRVVRTCDERAGSIRADVLGRVSEAEVNRALNRLEADGYVDCVDGDDTSPVGKGRPQYTLATERGAVVDALVDDEQVGDLATQVADSL